MPLTFPKPVQLGHESMNSIKDAIVRVGRSAKQLESYKEPNKAFNSIVPPRNPSSKLIRKADRNLSKDDLRQFRPLVDGYLRKMYQEFLHPLEISNLKTFNSNIPKFDKKTAKDNWLRKSGTSVTSNFNKYLEDRIIFDQLLDLLVEMTPEDLKLRGTNDKTTVSRIFQLEEAQQKNYKPCEIPRYHFHELPCISDFSVESFERYIYFLTHLKILYQNALSLQNGIVPIILLHTHKLTNKEYKSYRSAHTYNYLIKFFGYDKNQSTFARELLLVMRKDGHSPNTETINTLLKICKTHSHIRSLTNTYQLVIKYLKLSKALNIPIDLTTWCRVYDLINNIFLKELFINKMISLNLPVLRGLALRILDDYMQTTSDTKELISFIENDLCVDWKVDTKYLNKIIFHLASNRPPEDLQEIWNFFSNSNTDDHSPKYLFEGISKNKEFSDNRIIPALAIYSKLDTHLLNNPDTYKILLLLLCENRENFAFEQVALALKGLIHDATNFFVLPQDRVVYGATQASPENYKIIKRLMGPKLTRFEGRLHVYSRSGKFRVSELDKPLNQDEVTWWNETKVKLAAQSFEIAPSVLSLVFSTLRVSEEEVSNYEKVQHLRAEDSRNRDRLRKLNTELDHIALRHMFGKKTSE